MGTSWSDIMRYIKVRRRQHSPATRATPIRAATQVMSGFAVQARSRRKDSQLHTSCKAALLLLTKDKESDRKHDGADQGSFKSLLGLGPSFGLVVVDHVGGLVGDVYEAPDDAANQNRHILRSRDNCQQSGQGSQ